MVGFAVLLIALLIMIMPSWGVVAAAQDGTPATTPGTQLEGILLEYTLPAEAHLMPAPDQGRTPSLAVLYTVWEPGASYDYDETIEGTFLRCVLGGSLSLTIDGPGASVAWAGSPSSLEPVTPATELNLASGDCVVHPAAAPFSQRNAGPDELVMLEVLHFWTTMAPPWHDPEPAEGMIAERRHSVGRILPDDWAKLPAGPVQIRIERFVLDPGENVPAVAPPALRAIGPQELLDTIAVQEQADGSVTNIMDRPVPALVVTLIPGHAPSGTPAS